MFSELSFEDSIDLALNGVFITTSEIWFDEKLQNAHLKIGTELVVHSVIIDDDGIWADVTFSYDSWTKDVRCGNCGEYPGPQDCIDSIDSGTRCPGMTLQMDFEYLATKCRLANMEDLAPYIQSVDIIGTQH